MDVVRSYTRSYARSSCWACNDAIFNVLTGTGAKVNRWSPITIRTGQEKCDANVFSKFTI